MTKALAIELAKAAHDKRCRAWWQFWTHGGTEPNDLDYGFHHGWISINGYSIGSHEAPGPTYNGD